MIITLSGFMGSGKSNAGKSLASMLGCRYVDLDERTEQACGAGIPEIFAAKGEKEFRKAECETLKTILEEETSRGPANVCVLALGGGTLMTAECREMVRRNTFCVYLRATTRTLAENLAGTEADRPMLNTPGKTLEERIEELMSQRSAIYEAAADAAIDTDGLLYDEIASEIIALLPRRIF